MLQEASIVAGPCLPPRPSDPAALSSRHARLPYDDPLGSLPGDVHFRYEIREEHEQENSERRRSDIASTTAPAFPPPEASMRSSRELARALQLYPEEPLRVNRHRHLEHFTAFHVFDSILPFGV